MPLDPLELTVGFHARRMLLRWVAGGSLQPWGGFPIANQLGWKGVGMLIPPGEESSDDSTLWLCVACSAVFAFPAYSLFAVR
jgi:hypothetical protein